MSNDQDIKNAITNTATAFYNYPSLANYTIFTAKSTGKPLFCRASNSYPQYFYTLLITIIFRPGQEQRLELLQ